VATGFFVRILSRSERPAMSTETSNTIVSSRETGEPSDNATLETLLKMRAVES
jgi:hypothetical protein